MEAEESLYRTRNAYPPSRQRVILIGTLALRRQHRETPLAFFFAPDGADDRVSTDPIACELSEYGVHPLDLR
jgi:hypothetical protein